MPRRLTQRQIEAFAAIMQSGSVKAASALLHVSQPSVSRLVKDLEDEIKYRLFVRRGRGLEPTASARMLYAEVERSFIGLDRIDKVARQVGKQTRSVVVFGCIYIPAFGFLADFLASAAVKRRNFLVSCRIQTTMTLIDWVRAGLVDLALVCPIEMLHGVHIEYEQELACVCLVPIDHPLARRGDPVSLQELHGEPLILPDEGTLRATIPNASLRAQLAEDAILDANIWLAVGAAVERGLGIGIVDPFTADLVSSNGRVAAIPLRDHLPYRLALVRHPDRPVSDTVALFARSLIEALEQRPDVSLL